MTGTFLNAIIFLISTVFDLYIFVLIIRLILAWVGADSSHQLVRFIISLTSFIIKPMRRYIPDFRGVETATLVLILILEIVKFLLVCLLTFGFPNIFGLLLIALADSIKLLVEVLFYAILFQFVISWIQPNTPIYRELSRFTSPILRPLQKVIPPVSNVDITPVIACVILQLINIIIVDKLMSIGLGIAIIG